MYRWLRLTGTGKSTCVRVIIDALGVAPEDVTYVAYTGKAAQVLSSKGCPNATTAHKLLYKSVLNEKTGKFYNIIKRVLDKPYKVIVVDEVSMLPKEMWDLLLTHHVYVLALGDPAQLPPVRSESNGVLDHPHVFLDEIMRQAKDSEIIRLTMDIREGKSLQEYRGNEVRVVNQKELNAPGIWKWPEQIIVAKNATRNSVNNFIRTRLLNRPTAAPTIGDKVVCLKNNWQLLSTGGDALVNGQSGTLTMIRDKRIFNPYVKDILCADFTPDYESAGIFFDLHIDGNIFIEHEPSKNKCNADLPIPIGFLPEQFDYGYAITCHKSQGSQYEKVLVLEEFLRSSTKEEHKRWLYTAATRASDKLIIVKDYRL